MTTHRPGLEVISSHSIKTREVLGEGGFGKVYHAHHEHWGDVALKKATANFFDKRVRQRLIKEAEKLNRLSHPHIIQMLGVVLDDGCNGIVLEFMPHGALDAFLESYEVSWPMKVDFIEGIVLAMNYLHTLSSPIIHRDLKPPNVLVGRDLRVKVTDFGLSMWRSYSDNSSRGMGTVTHVPPEAWTNVSADPEPSYDIYSFAILVWEVCTQEMPFQGVANGLIKEGVCSGQRPSHNRLLPDTPPVLEAIITDCWTHDKNFRPAFHILKKTLEEDATRRNVDMKKERLHLMQLIANTETKTDGVENEDNSVIGMMRAVELNDYQPNIAREVDPQYPASAQLANNQGHPVPTHNPGLDPQSQSPPMLDRPYEQTVHPNHPASSNLPSSATNLDNSNALQPGTDAVWAQPNSMHVNSMCYPETDGDPGEIDDKISNNPRPDLLRRNIAGADAYGQSGSGVPYVRRLNINSAPPHSGSTLPRDTEPDAEPENMQSIHSPQEYRPTLNDSFTGIGAQPPPAYSQGPNVHPNQQGPMPNQNLPGFMRDFLPNFKIEMPDLTKCNSYVVHNNGEFGTTVICNSEGNKHKNNIQIGKNNVMHVYTAPQRTSGATGARPHQPVPVPPNISRNALMRSSKVVDSENMDILGKHLGRYWKALGRKLGFSTGELDQINADYHTDGLEEKIRQMLEKWKVREGKSATVGVLADKLWSIERYGLAAMLKG